MKTQYDAVIIGAGPGGSTAAMELCARGLSTLIIEKESFPRYHIGESLTGEAGAYLRRAGFEAALRDAPVKRGVTVYGREGKNSFHVPVMGRTAEGRFRASTWQVRRSHFDSILLEAARERGAELCTGEAMAPVREGARVRGVHVRAKEREWEIRAGVVVDASGQNTFLSRHGVAASKERGTYANQTAVFSQVVNTIREGDSPDDTYIFYAGQHHWAWFIPLDADVVSVGVVVPVEYLRDRRSRDESLEVFLARELRELNPQLHRRVPDTRFVEPVRAFSNYSYNVPVFGGPGYLCVGDAHRFIDPIFSFGVNLALNEGQSAAQAIYDTLGAEGGAADECFMEYQRTANHGQDLLNDMIDFFWLQPLHFSLLVHGASREEFIDYFAGRVYDDGERPGLMAMRRALRGRRPRGRV
jgi:FADH2-dependent halogenase